MLTIVNFKLDCYDGISVPSCCIMPDKLCLILHLVLLCAPEVLVAGNRLIIRGVPACIYIYFSILVQVQ